MPHIHEKIDFISNVFIVNGDAVLLRIHDKYGHWWPPGGHVELDEDPAEAAIREAKEEVGLDVTLVSAFPVDEASLKHADKTYSRKEGRDLTMPYFMNRHWIDDHHEHISFEFFGTSVTRDIEQTIEGERSENIRWFTRDELDDPGFELGETVKRYAKAALDALGI